MEKLPNVPGNNGPKKVKSGTGPDIKRQGATKKNRSKGVYSYPEPIKGYIAATPVEGYSPKYLIADTSNAKINVPYYNKVNVNVNVKPSHYENPYLVGNEVHPFGIPKGYTSSVPKTSKNTSNSLYRYLTNKGAQSGRYSARLARINPDKLSKLSGDAALEYLKDNFTSTKALEIKNFFDSELKGIKTAEKKALRIKEILKDFTEKAKQNNNTRTRIIGNISKFTKNQDHQLEQRKSRINRSSKLKEYLEEQKKTVLSQIPDYGPGEYVNFYNQSKQPYETVYTIASKVSPENMHLQPNKTKKNKVFNPLTIEELELKNLSTNNIKRYMSIENAKGNARRIAAIRTEPHSTAYYEMVKKLTNRIKRARGLNFDPSKPVITGFDPSKPLITESFFGTRKSVLPSNFESVSNPLYGSITGGPIYSERPPTPTSLSKNNLQGISLSNPTYGYVNNTYSTLDKSNKIPEENIYSTLNSPTRNEETLDEKLKLELKKSLNRKKRAEAKRKKNIAPGYEQASASASPSGYEQARSYKK